MKKRITIVDVAKAAKVSKSTVSLVLQASPLVKKQTRHHVKQVMADLGYVYNRSAATLRSSKNQLIGLIINDLRNPFFTDFATALQMALYEQGYSTVISNTDENPDMQSQIIEAMVEHGVSAIVFSPAYGAKDKTIAQLKRAKIPVIQVLRQLSADTETFPFASFDYQYGGRMAIEHLMAQGCQSIAFVGGITGQPITHERMSGYLSILKAQHLKTQVFTGENSRRFGHDIATSFVRSHPHIEAAICFNDRVALGMLNGFSRMGIRVGEDFKLVGFDGIGDCLQVYPQLSSVHCETGNFGRKIANDLVDWLEHGKKPQAIYRAPATLVVRASSRSISHCPKC